VEHDQWLLVFVWKKKWLLVFDLVSNALERIPHQRRAAGGRQQNQWLVELFLVLSQKALCSGLGTFVQLIRKIWQQQALYEFILFVIQSSFWQQRALY
jgi:hypothetical protein